MKKRENEGETLEATQPQVPVLLSEQADPIERVKREANEKAFALNQLNKVKPFTSGAELNQILANAGKICLEETLRRSPEAKKMHDSGFDLNKMGFRRPLEVDLLANLIQSVKADERRLVYVKYDSASSQWVVNDAILNAEIKNKYQIWAETAEEISRYNAAKWLSDYIENDLRPGNSGRMRVLKEMLTTVEGCFVPSVNFIKGSYKY